jgi:hypothetical protein
MAKSGARDVKFNGAQSRGYSPDGMVTTNGGVQECLWGVLLAIPECIGVMRMPPENSLDRK